MYHNVITVFNFHEKTGAWYTTVFKGVNLVEHQADTPTRDAGITNADTAEAIIHVRQDRLSCRDPDTGVEKQYARPKEYAALADPAGRFTFTPEQDFFVVGNHDSDVPLTDDEYESEYGEGLYHFMNRAHDAVYVITSSTYYNLLPHFEIGGK